MARHRTTTLAVLAACVAIGAIVHAGKDHNVSDGGPDRTAIIGAWTLNRSLSDTGEPARDPGDRMRGGNRGGFGGGRGAGRGGRGGGFPGGSQSGFGGARDGDKMAQRQDAVRDLAAAPSHLTIVDANGMLIITTNDGRTTRLMPDDSRVKEESAGTERRTKWDNGKLVSRISGGGIDATETYSVDAGHHELLVIVTVGGGRDTSRVFHRLYTADAR